MNSIELVRQWHFRTHRLQIAHYDTATHFEKMNLWLGVPVIILSTVVGTTIFATLSKSPSITIQIVDGLLSVAAGVLASLHTFLKYTERAEKHRVAGAKYAALKAELEMVLVLSLKDEVTMKEFLESFCVKRIAVHEESPTVPQRILERAKIKAKADENQLAEVGEST